MGHAKRQKCMIKNQEKKKTTNNYRQIVQILELADRILK